MREILFRGKRLDNGKWVFGDLMTKYPHHEGPTIVESGCIYHEVEPETVGQYTGLVDKNGEKIFEGDVVKGHYYINRNKKRIVGFVRFVRDGWHIEGVKQYEYVTTRLTPAFERIGITHDNPELLEVLGDEA